MYITIISKPLLVTMVLWTMSRTCSSFQTNMDRLYKEIFQNYSHKTLPVLDVSDVVVVTTTAFIVNVNNFDELHGELSVTMSFWMKWTEKRIHWNVSDYGGITSLVVLPEDMWRPRVFLLQTSDTITDICNTSTQPILNNNGSVHWLSSKVLKVSCSVDVAHFPFDTQTCMLTFTSWSFTTESLILYPESTHVRTNFFNDNSQWELRPSSLQPCYEYTNTPPCLNMTIVLKRRSEFFMFYIIIPLLFLGLINNLVFIMPPTSGERTSVAVTTFLSFVVYMDMVNDVVPQSSRPMAMVYYYITALLIYSSTIMFLCIVSLRIYDRTNAVPIRIQTAVWIAGFHFVKCRAKTVVVKPIKGRIVYSTSDDREAENGSSVRGVETETCAGEEMSDNNCKELCTWKTVGKTFDCYCFILLYVSLVTLSTIMAYIWMNA